MKQLRLVQLPVPQPAALAATGNVPLAAGCLAVSAQVHGLTSRGLAMEVVPPAITDSFGDTQLADYVARDTPDFVGLSLYLWNVERSLHLAREIKRRSPRTKILIGGPEVSADNPFVMQQSGFDVAVSGEAEDTFSTVMHSLLAGKDLKGVPGVSVRSLLGMSSFGPNPTANFPLTAYGSPYLAGLVEVEPQRSTYVETVRGCRSHCTYCFYPRSSNVLRVLDVERSAALFASLRERGAREIVFLDPTFNHRPDFDELLEALVQVNHDRSVSCFAEVRAEGLTRAQAVRLARAGFTKLEIGLQSVNRDTLKRIKRGGSPDKVAEAAKMLRDVGVDLLVDLIIGLPGDSAEDVARGVDFLLENGLRDQAQVFILSLLPGTAMRASAASDGLIYDPAPPYRVQQTATMNGEELSQCLFAAEEQLGRRLDELPRPHLVEACAELLDVLTIDVDDSLTASRAASPAAQHVAMWLEGSDLYRAREVVLQALNLRVATDPYGMLDVVLQPRREFPLDLIDQIRRELDRGTPSYASRALAHRGENLQRRISVVLPSAVHVSASWLEALREEVPVFRNQHAHEAAARAAELGDELLSARIVDREIDRRLWTELVQKADPAAVAFAVREHESAWTRGVVEYGQLG